MMDRPNEGSGIARVAAHPQLRVVCDEIYEFLLAPARSINRLRGGGTRPQHRVFV